MPYDPTKPMPGHKGDYACVAIPSPSPGDGKPFVRGNHYLSVSLVTWFVNLDSNVFRKRSVTGTAALQLGGETFRYAFETYTLDGGVRTAPGFNRPLLPPTPYTGGSLQLNPFLKGAAESTALAKVVAGVAQAALTASASAVSLGTATPAAAALTAASGAAISGVEGMLAAEPKGPTVFEPTSGVSLSVNPAVDLRGAESYFLVRRGSKGLESGKFSVVKLGGGLIDLHYDERPFEDGAWLLFRVERLDTYGEARQWAPDRDAFLADLDTLMESFRLGGVDAAGVLAELTPSGGDKPTRADSYIVLTDAISRDSTMIDRDRLREKASVRVLMDAARKAARDNAPQHYFDVRDGVHAFHADRSLAAPAMAVAAIHAEARAMGIRLPGPASDLV